MRRHFQSTVDQFRAALGGVNNGNVAGPLDSGRREINWDGGGSTATALVPTPFPGFLVTRGALFTTPGTGFVQAPVDGLVTTSETPTTRPSSPPSAPSGLQPDQQQPDDGRVLRPQAAATCPRSQPGSAPSSPTSIGPTAVPVVSATTPPAQRYASTTPTASSFYVQRLPPSPGDASLCSSPSSSTTRASPAIKILQRECRARPHDERRSDVVVMDDFIFGEPRLVK